jgi:septal ring factor EnvC (AmiA/AmiB activator)
METAVAASDELKKYITGLEQNIIQFEKKAAVLEQRNKTLERDNKTLEQENRTLEEKLKLALFRQFGRHAERFTGEGQLVLFDAGETAAPVKAEGPEEKTVVVGYRRRKGGPETA